MILCWRRHGKAGGCRIHYGGVAQLGEHLPCKQGVKSSNLSISICRKQLNESESKTKLEFSARQFTNLNERKWVWLSEHTMYLENCILKIWYKVQTEKFETNIKTSEVLHESVTNQTKNKQLLIVNTISQRCNAMHLRGTPYPRCESIG